MVDSLKLYELKSQFIKKNTESFSQFIMPYVMPMIPLILSYIKEKTNKPKGPQNRTKSKKCCSTNKSIIEDSPIKSNDGISPLIKSNDESSPSKKLIK